MDSFHIRPEIPDDVPAIFYVNVLAFGQAGEALLVDALRDAGHFYSDLSLVAVQDKRIIGYILFPPITIESPQGNVPALALAPLAVLPEFQGQGIGSALVEEGLKACRSSGHKIVIVVGHPGYYARFGFLPERSRDIEPPFPVPDEVFMVCALVPGALEGVHGVVRYPPAFDRVVT